MSTILDRAAKKIEPRALPSQYRSLWQCLLAGFRRQRWGAVAALAAGWTSLPIALWAAVLVGIAGAIGGVIAAVGATFQLGSAFLGATQGISLFGIIGGAVAGALTGFGVVYGGSLLSAPGQVIVSLITGAIVAAIITVVVVVAEPWTLKLRGYRRMSRREEEKVAPLLEEVAQRMGLGSVPPVMVTDVSGMNAWAHVGALAMTRIIIANLERDELAGILAHELHHWSVGDTVGHRFVWACAWPVAVSLNVGAWLARQNSLLGFIGFVLFWPAWVLTKFLIVPVVARHGRQQEYDADAAAVKAGYREGMYQALTKIADFETGRTGWEGVLAATHPPTELRLEKLEAPQERATAPTAESSGF